MVSYYNTLPYSQKHSAPNLSYPPGQHWQWSANYHNPPNPQFLEMDGPHAHHQMYYNPHHMFHTSAAAAGSAVSEWHSPSHPTDNFLHNATSGHQMHQIGNGTISNSSTSSGSTSSALTGPIPSNTNLNESPGSGEAPIAEGLPSPPITVSGSEISSPGLGVNNSNNSPITTNSNHNTINNQASPVKAQYYDWMKKPSYPAQPAPGKTRTKDKYRVVYTDYQRLELEKEYCTSRYITIRRKTELAQSLSLSERQVKIWFQNRRAKERKQNKKGNDSTVSSLGNSMQHNEYINIMDTKPKLEPGLHLPHSLHSMSSMAAMSMPTMSLHHHLHSHHSLAAVSAATAAAHSHQIHHQPPIPVSATTGVSTLTM